MKSKNPPVAVVFSDSHLQDRAWKHNTIIGDAYYSFEQIVDTAIELDVPLIGAGDLIDKVINGPGPAVFLRKQFEKLADAGLTLYYIQGQHEFHATTPWLQIGGDHAVHFHKKKIRIGDLTLYGLDFQSSEDLAKELKNIPKDVGVLVAHQVWAEFMGDITLPEGSFKDIPRVSLLITGDYHKTIYKDVGLGATGQELSVFSPGSTCMQDISEPPDKHFGLLHADGVITIRNLATRPYLEVTPLMTEEDFAEFLSTIPKKVQSAADNALIHVSWPSIRKPLLRVPYFSEIRDVRRRLERAIGDSAHLFLKEIPKQLQVADGKQPQASGDMLTLKDGLDQVVDAKKTPEAYSLCKRLLDAGENRDDIAAELSRWIQQQTE